MALAILTRLYYRDGLRISDLELKVTRRIRIGKGKKTFWGAFEECEILKEKFRSKSPLSCVQKYIEHYMYSSNGKNFLYQ